MTLRPSRAAALELGERGVDGRRVARRRARRGCGATASISTVSGTVRNGALAGRERRGLALREAVDADDDLLAGLDRGEARARWISTSARFM